MNSEIIVLMDIDGTVNALTGSFPHTATHWFGKWSSFEVKREEVPAMFVHLPKSINEFKISCSHELMKSLEEIALLPNVDMRWFTSWGEDTPYFTSRAGVGVEWTLFPMGDDSGPWWKLEALRRIMDDNPDAFVILLDDQSVDGSHEEFMESLVEETGRLCVIAPNGNLGLTRADVGFLRRIIENPLPGILG